MYRTNYKLYNKDGNVVAIAINDACFSSHKDMHLQDKVIVFVLTKYGERTNTTRLSPEDVKIYLKELNKIGFKNKYLGIQKLDDHFDGKNIKKDYYSGVVRKEYAKPHYLEGDSDDAHVVEVKMSDYKSAKSLLAGLTAIRYLYEADYSWFSVKYMELLRMDHHIIKRMSKVEKFQLAHFITDCRHYLGGHTNLDSENRKFVTHKEFKENLKNEDLYRATDLFKGDYRNDKDRLHRLELWKKMPLPDQDQNMSEVEKIIQIYKKI